MVVNLWYSACPPCTRELADFAVVHAEVGDRVRFVGVDPLDSVDVMQRFASDRGVGYELLRDDGGAFVDALGVVNFPVTLFVAPDGEIVGQGGEIDGDELRARIEELF
jgi:peroxiredoxin